MGGPGSGRRRLSEASHILAGTWRPDRAPAAGRPLPPTPADRRRVLSGLTGLARRVAARALDEYGDFSVLELETVRRWAQSTARLDALEAANDLKGIYREARLNLNLLRSLHLALEKR